MNADLGRRLLAEFVGTALRGALAALAYDLIAQPERAAAAAVAEARQGTAGEVAGRRVLPE